MKEFQLIPLQSLISSIEITSNDNDPERPGTKPEGSCKPNGSCEECKTPNIGPCV